MPLDTKVRWKGGTLGFLILTALVHNVVGSGPKCNKIPPTQVPDNFIFMSRKLHSSFEIQILQDVFFSGGFSNQG